MSKKRSAIRKPGGAAAMATVEEVVDHAAEESRQESNGESHPVANAAKPKRTAPAKTAQSSDGNFGVGEIKKAAAFANSIGGLDKAIALLQILKVAKEIQ